MMEDVHHLILDNHLIIHGQFYQFIFLNDHLEKLKAHVDKYMNLTENVLFQITLMIN